MNDLATLETPIKVYTGPCLLPSRWQAHEFPVGLTLQEIVEQSGHGLYPVDYLVVSLQGQRVTPAWWERIRPKSGTICHVISVPRGTGEVSKETLRLIAGVGSALAGIAVPGLLGLEGVAQWVVRTGIMIGGFWAIQTFMPITDDENKSYSFSGARNRLAPYDPIPRVYGRMRIVPPLCAVPLTSIEGNEQYITLLFCLGYRPLEIAEGTFMIGDVPLNRLTDFAIEIRDGWRYPDDFEHPFRLYTNDVAEELMARTLQYAPVWTVGESARNSVHANVATFVTTPETVQISMDLTFPQGLGRRQGTGGVQSHSVDLQVQYRAWKSYVDLDQEIEPYSGSEYQSPWITVTPRWARDVYNETAADFTYAEILGYVQDWTALIYNILSDILALGGSLNQMPQSMATQLAEAVETMWLRSQNSEDRYGPDITPDQEQFVSDIDLFRDSIRPLTDSVDDDEEWNDTDYAEVISRLLLAVQMTRVLLELEYIYSEADGGTPVAVGLDEWIAQLLDLSTAYPGEFPFEPTGIFRITDHSKGLIRHNFSWTVPAGKYEVRARRTSTESDDDDYLEDVEVSAFRSIRAQQPLSRHALETYAFLCLKIRATDQLSGVADQFSCEVRTPLWYTEDGTTWLGPALRDSSARSVYRNPAWALVDTIIGAANKQPADFARLDGARLLEFADWCYDNNYHFDSIFDRATTVQRAMEDICRTAKASPAIRDGLYSVVQDVPQDVTAAVITLRNSDNFSAAKSMAPRPDALRMRFLNPAKDWAVDEIYVYEDGFGEPGTIGEVANLHTAYAPSASYSEIRLRFVPSIVHRIYDTLAAADLTLTDYTISYNHGGAGVTLIVPNTGVDEFGAEIARYRVYATVQNQAPDLVEELDIPGIVDVPEDPTHLLYSGQAWKLGRYLLSVAKHRSEIYTADLDFENLVFERGDQVEINMDIVQWGLGSGRVKAVDRNSAGELEAVTLDTRVEMEAGKVYQMRFRNKRGALTDAGTLTTVAGEQLTVAFATALDDDVAGIVVEAGDLALWGLEDAISFPCIVRDIRPRNDLSAEVTFIAAAPGVHDADLQDIPVYEARAFIPPDIATVQPSRPAIRKIVTDESVLARDVDGSLAARIAMDVHLSKAKDPAQREANARVDTFELQFRPAFDPPIGTKPKPAPWTNLGKFPAAQNRLYIGNVEDGETYDVRLRAITRDGVPSEWRERLGILVVGKSALPPDIGFLEVYKQEIRWTYDPPADLAGFRVRFIVGAGGAWEDAGAAHTGLIRDSRWNFSGLEGGGNYVLFVKAVDTSGNESAVAASVAVTLQLGLQDKIQFYAGYDVLPVLDSSGYDWPGVEVNLSIDGSIGELIADPFNGSDLDSALAHASPGEPAFHALIDSSEPIHYPTFKEGTFTYPVGDGVIKWNLPFDFYRHFVIEVDADDWVFEAKNETADPDSGLTEWHPIGTLLKIVDGDDWFVRVRLLRSWRTPDNPPKIISFAQSDYADLLEEDIQTDVAATTGTAVTFAQPFWIVKTVTATIIQDGSFPDARTVEVSSVNQAGCTVTVYDASHAAVAGRVDLQVRGY